MREEKNSKKINENLKDLVITRIEVASPNLKLAIGSHGVFTKEEMIYHIKKEDEIGKSIVESHLSFMKALTNGQFTRAVASAY